MFRLRCSLRHCLLALPFSLATVQGLLAQSTKEPSSKPESASVTEVAEDITVSDPAAATKLQTRVLTGIRQLTFEGKRAGEAYFGKEGRMLVFQSEREPENPFFQIYVMDRETGDTHRVSPGHGKTTCAWLHPSGKQVVYASTELDPDALQKQKAEIDFRASGQTKRYSWDYDPTYDLIVRDISGENPVRLTDTVGYDAEGSYSPDGSLICFASNRRAYSGDLNDEEKKLFEVDPSSAMDLYIMKADGTDVRRLTDTIGYDGGPFFSPDGKKICFRRFAKNGAVAEIMTMNIDGSDQRSLTHLEKVSWAPFYHPTGEYLVFATNRHGFDNFEIYMVDAEGKNEPVRVTYRKGFDGLPVFSPDGKTLIWTSNNNSSQSQLFQAKWDHAAARELISANPPAATPKVGRAGDEH
ncbi:MAG: peptidase M28, partial [Pirellulales bacterium]